jgi:hypothetical protein
MQINKRCVQVVLAAPRYAVRSFELFYVNTLQKSGSNGIVSIARHEQMRIFSR